MFARAVRILGFISKPNARNASYIKPKFEGGKAKPHGFGLLAFGNKLESYQNFHQDRFDEWRTIYNYPCMYDLPQFPRNRNLLMFCLDPERDESQE